LQHRKRLDVAHLQAARLTAGVRSSLMRRTIILFLAGVLMAALAAGAARLKALAFVGGASSEKLIR
jgi:hypothetical protein